MRSVFVTRFAPSPTGRLHLGHAFSALIAYDATRAAGGCFLLRIEDIDRVRCRDEYVAGIFEDLAWLGLDWEEPVRRQSQHFADYEAALGRLDAMGVLYPCICTRKEIAREVERSGAAPHGAEGPLYPGTCRKRGKQTVARAITAGRPHALRLDSARAVTLLKQRGHWPLTFTDTRHGMVRVRQEALGDVVLARKDVPTSYHLAVSVDDALQEVSDIIRGDDLLASTHVHRLLQALLDLPEPRYHHHRLITDESGRRFAKRDRAQTLAELRACGDSPQAVRDRLMALGDDTSGALAQD